MLWEVIWSLRVVDYKSTKTAGKESLATVTVKSRAC